MKNSFDFDSINKTVKNVEKLKKELSKNIQDASKHFEGSDISMDDKKQFIEIMELSQKLASDGVSDYGEAIKIAQDLENRIKNPFGTTK